MSQVWNEIIFVLVISYYDISFFVFQRTIWYICRIRRCWRCWWRWWTTGGGRWWFFSRRKGVTLWKKTGKQCLPSDLCEWDFMQIQSVGWSMPPTGRNKGSRREQGMHTMVICDIETHSDASALCGNMDDLHHAHFTPALHQGVINCTGLCTLLNASIILCNLMQLTALHGSTPPPTQPTENPSETWRTADQCSEPLLSPPAKWSTCTAPLHSYQPMLQRADCDTHQAPVCCSAGSTTPWPLPWGFFHAGGLIVSFLDARACLARTPWPAVHNQ